MAFRDLLHRQSVFETAPPERVTAKDGPETSSSARYCLDSQEQMACAVECLSGAMPSGSVDGAQSSASGV